MKNNKFKSILTLLFTFIFTFAVFTGCSSQPTESGQALAEGGTLILKVNPEIAVNYDENGLVTSVKAKNDDAKAILANYTGFEGKECRSVVSELVTSIGEAGYFVEEIEGEKRQITIEIEKGSRLPNNTFIDDVVRDVKNCINSHDWSNPINVFGESDYGITDYVDTDYGIGNDGVTDYNDTDYGPNNDGVTDYIDTDYGVGNDGVTDYIDTDYGVGNDGVTDYNDTDYGPNNDGVTDYIDTDYGVGNDGVTDYNDTDYGPNNDGVTDYNDGNSGYGNSNYGDSGYDGDSDYRD